MACLTCGSPRCTEHEGSIVLTQCPLKMVDDRANRIMRAARYARESNKWPTAGGSYDESPAFLEAESLIRSDISHWRAHFGLK